MMRASRQPGSPAWLITDQPNQPVRQSFTADEWSTAITRQPRSGARQLRVFQHQKERNRRDARIVKGMFLTFALLMALMTLLGWVLS